MIMKKPPVTKHRTQEMTNIMADAIGYRNDDEVVICSDWSRSCWNTVPVQGT